MKEQRCLLLQLSESQIPKFQSRQQSAFFPSDTNSLLLFLSSLSGPSSVILSAIILLVGQREATDSNLLRGIHVPWQSMA